MGKLKRQHTDFGQRAGCMYCFIFPLTKNPVIIKERLIFQEKRQRFYGRYSTRSSSKITGLFEN